MKQALLTGLLALAVLAAGALAGEDRSILVELYTSQGCSSCPPADALLTKLTLRKGLIAVSLPITYWDMLGWKDTLASEANTRRQKAYAAALGRGGVYTPQIIVDGTRDVVGSREDDVEAAIDAAAQERAGATNPDGALQTVSDNNLTAPSVGIGLARTPQKLHISIGAAPDAGPKHKLNATIWMFRLRSAVAVHIGAGENSGRTWTYRNVVSDIKDLGRWNGRAVSLDLPPADAKTPQHDGVVVVVQQGGYGRVLGAAYIAHAEYYAQQ
jgi:hypothetical protein